MRHRESTSAVVVMAQLTVRLTTAAGPGGLRPQFTTSTFGVLGVMEEFAVNTKCPVLLFRNHRRQ